MDEHTGSVGFNRGQMMELEHVGRSVFDGLASGASVERILAQEGGRLAQVMGEGSGGLGGSFAALGRLALGPVGVIGLVATACVAAAAAAESYEDKLQGLDRALSGAGRASGATAAELETIAEAAATAGNTTVKAGVELEEALLRTGKVAVSNFQPAIAIQRDFAAAMGIDAKKAAQELATGLAEPSKFADQLNESLHFLTAAEREHIRSLEESGRRTEAQALLMDRLKNSVGGAADHLTILGKALHGVSTAFSDAWSAAGKFLDRLIHVGGAEDLAALKAQRADLVHQRQNGGETIAIEGGAAIDVPLAETDAKIKALDGQIRSLQVKVNQPALNDISNRALDVIKSLSPTYRKRQEFDAQLSQLEEESRNGWQGLDAEAVKLGKRDLSALKRARDTLKPEEDIEVARAELQAQLAKRPGSAERSKLQGQLAALNDAGRLITPEGAASIEASGQERGSNIGARADRAANRRGEAAANKVEDAARKVEALQAELLGQDAKLVSATATIQEAEKLGVRVPNRDALLAAARERDAEPARKRASRTAEEQDKADTDLLRATLDGLRYAQDKTGLIERQRDLSLREIDAQEKRDKDDLRAQAGGPAPTINPAALDGLLATKTREYDQKRANERAATTERLADNQLEREKSLASATEQLLTESQGLARTTAERRAIAEKLLALQQQVERDELEAAIRTDCTDAAIRRQILAAQQAGQRASVDQANASPLEAYRNSLPDYSRQGAVKDAAENDAVEFAQNLGGALERAETGAEKFGKAAADVAKSLADTVLKQLNENFLVRPLTNLLQGGLNKLFPSLANTGADTAHTAAVTTSTTALAGLTAATNSAAAAMLRVSASSGGGGGLGDLFGGSGGGGQLSVFSDDTEATDEALDAFALGTRFAPGGLSWVGERGPELMNVPRGASILSASHSLDQVSQVVAQAALMRQAQSAPITGGDLTLHYNPVYQTHAPGADPAQLQRATDAFQAHAKNEPQRVAAYFKAVGIGPRKAGL